MITLNRNNLASHAARHLQTHYTQLATSTERLSTGLRVNSADDDAAGLAIRELMRADVAALNQGVRNANDAISMLQVADGSLGIIDEKLIRMKELAEQAATGTYDSTQRLMIDSEFQAMGAEIDRIARATDFNGIHLLDGSLSGNHNGKGLNSTGRMKIHFGTANDSAEDYYYVKIGDCTTAGLGLRNEIPFPTATGAMSWINEAQIDYAGRHIILDVTDGLAGHKDAAFMTGIDFYALPVGLKNITVTSNALSPHPYHKPHVSLFGTNGTQLTGPSITGTNVVIISDTVPAQTRLLNGANWWNGITPTDFIQNGIAAGVFNSSATYNGHTNIMQGYKTVGNLRIDLVTPQTEIGSKWNGTAYSNGVATEEIIQINEITSDLSFFIGGHDNPGGGCNRYRLRIEADITDDFLRKIKGYESENPVYGDIITIETQQKAQEALITIDGAIEKKDKIRAHLGALQNRFENTVSNLSIQGESIQASESRISDADIAVEMTTFVRNQILTQSAVAMLGQANSFPHMMLQLLN